MSTANNASEFASEFDELTRKSEEFGLRVKMRREKFGFSQQELARKVCVSLTTIQNYEGGQLPKGEHAIKLSFVLKISLDELLLGDSLACPSPSLSDPLPLSEHPVIPTKTAKHCSRCERLEEKLERMETKLEKVEQQRDKLVDENKDLWRENGNLRVVCVTLEERQKTCCPEDIFKTTRATLPNEIRASI